MIVAKDLLIKMHFRLQIGNEHYKNPYLHTKMHYLPKKTLKVNSLFEHISTYLYHSRGVHSSPDQVIGAGTRPLLWYATSTAWPYKEYGIENPGFHRIHAIIKSCDRQIHPIPLDEKGIDISSLYNTNSNVAYVTPSHQFPLGIIMPLSRRLELLKWANNCGGYIIEDDYDGEFRYAGKPIPSLQSLDSNERVIYMGTFSKSFYLLYEWDMLFYHHTF